jgi:hypothetical protein
MIKNKDSWCGIIIDIILYFNVYWPKISYSQSSKNEN